MQTARRSSLRAAMALAAMFVPGMAAQDPDPHAAHRQGAAAAVQTAPETARLSIPDVNVLDQHGRQLRFRSDLVGRKAVAINFIFTTCTTICPPLAATFARIQNLMGDRLGKDFYLISVSVDPVTDTPARMKAWGDKFRAKPGWYFITGAKPEMDTLLKSLGAYTSRKEDHAPLVLIGNDSKGIWTRANGLGNADRLAKIIDAMIQGARPEAAKERGL